MNTKRIIAAGNGNFPSPALFSDNLRNAIALGTFDGLHAGHRAVLDGTAGEYRRIAVTFGKSPKSFMDSSVKMLMSPDDKLSDLHEYGMSDVTMLDFDRVRDLTAEEFLNKLFEVYSPAKISCGFNYRFGKNGSGNAEMLKKFCNDKNIKLNCCDPVMIDGVTVSSTGIKRLLEAGSIEQANTLLFKPFSFTAPVITGDRRGRTIGFPTINQRFPDYITLPRFGVYSAKVIIDNNSFNGITNIGIRPTFHSDYIISETHIIDYNMDLYGNSVKIIPLKFLRPEQTFSSVQQLKMQISLDISTAFG